MKKIFNLLVCLAAIHLIGSAFYLSDWVLFKKANFQVEFPAMPSTDSTVTDTKIGPITVYSYMYESAENANDSNLLYGLSVTSYPQEFPASSTAAFLNGFFDGVVKGAVTSTQGKLISQKDIEMKGYPGRQVSIDFGEGTAIISMKFILVKQTVYAIQTIAYPGKEINANAARFNASFSFR